MSLLKKIKTIAKEMLGKHSDANNNELVLQGVDCNFENVKQVHDQIPQDELGGSPLNKISVMAYLAKRYQIKSYVEIGVYKGKSFFPLSMIIANNGGKSYGIDPYENEAAYEEDIDDEEKKKLVNKLIKNHNFDKTFRDVIRFSKKLKWSRSIHIIRTRSNEATIHFQKGQIGMLHIDGNHDTDNVLEDYYNYEELICDRGFIIFDDTDWPSVKEAYEKIKARLVCVCEFENFAILQKIKKNEENITKASYLGKKLSHIYSRALATNAAQQNIAIGVLTYNHEEYIIDCVESIIKQKGDFKLKIIISDDCSEDGTLRKLEEYIQRVHNPNVEFEVATNQKNMGVFTNFWKLLNLCKGYDYVGFCEGDDRWDSNKHIQTHVDFLSKNPECALSANAITYIDQKGKITEDFKPRINGDIFTMVDLIKDNFIGNLSSCFHLGTNINNIDLKLKEYEMGDWLFNIFSSQYGDIGYLKNIKTHYRKHPKSYWSSMSEIKSCREVLRLIGKYNLYFNFNFDDEFSIYSDRCLIQRGDDFVEQIDLLIIDDVFPNTRSGFRYTEFHSYLKRYNSIKILCNGWSVKVLGSESIRDLVIKFKRGHPEYADKIEKFTHWHFRKAKLAYLVFLGNAFTYVELLESKGIPFIFELYPGGSFALNSPKSDQMLKRVLESPMFKKVIVTQKITYDYLINKKLCSADKIKYIFGVVSPEIDMISSGKKRNYGVDKDTLDLCFVAHRYSKDGADKGYDIFIEASKIIARRHDNVRFHIVGDYDESIIDISELDGKLNFYGPQDMKWFESFYLDKDILVSPNRPFRLGNGYFDGFPTASATDAGLRNTAVFCTDELDLNNGVFTSGVNLEFIKPDINSVVEKVEYYYINHEALKKLSLETGRKMKEIYSLQSQMIPRIELIDTLLMR
jgi:glycosyltransferase involved in cell wall biosynthesis